MMLYFKLALRFCVLLLAVSVVFAEPLDRSLENIPDEVKTNDVSAIAAHQPNHTRLWNLQDADILSVINEVSQETGKNFIVDPRVNGKVSLISSKPLSKNEVYQVFLSILSVLNYSAVQSGNVIKIIPNVETGESGVKVSTLLSPGKGDEVVVRVVPLQNISAAQLIPVIRPMLPQWSNVATYTPGNTLILLGRAQNLDRLMTVIQEVDQAANNNIQLVSLRHASASQVASVLNNLQAASRASGDTPAISIAVDERGNSILLSGPKFARIKMRMLIAQLDAPPKQASGNTEVIYLRYLQAKTFAPILGKIAENMVGKDAGARFDASTALNTTMSNQNQREVRDAPVSQSTIIQAEPNTNAVVITAPPTLMRALKAVVAKLDIRPAEVQVEAIIAEVEESNLRSLGIQWGSRNDNQSSSSAANNNAASNEAAITSFPPLGAGIFGIIPGGIELRTVLSMLENINGVDILSTPSLMVLDNQKAMIEIGQDVPYRNGSYATSNSFSTVQPFETIQSKPVTLKLEVIPQINLGSAIRLKIDLKNDTLQNPQNASLNPVINTSKISNAVIVKNDEILVIGGLIRNANNENINKVPLLGDLPVLGSFFQQKTRTVSKKNLMIFIKPLIVKDNDDAMSLSETKYSYIRGRQANFREELLDIDKERAKTYLPPWKNKKELPSPFETKAL